MPDPIRLTRAQLAKFLPDDRAIRAFENLFQVATVDSTSDITAIEALLDAVVGEIVGTGGVQTLSDKTFITPVIGAATGTSLSVSGQLTSTVATGTPPLVVSSTTNIPNLNASSLSGATFAAPGAIGSGTPSTIAATTLTITTPSNVSAAVPTIASAGTIAPTTPILFVSGVAAITTITAPAALTNGGQITIIPTGLFTTTAAGNIALASTAVVNKALIMTYVASTAKWYPSY